MSEKEKTDRVYRDIRASEKAPRAGLTHNPFAKLLSDEEIPDVDELVARYLRATSEQERSRIYAESKRIGYRAREWSAALDRAKGDSL